MRTSRAVFLAFSCLVGFYVQGLAGAAASGPLTESMVVERFINDIEKAPIPHQAYRRLEASSLKLNESAWLEAFTEYAPETGFRYRITSQGGSTRILNRVLKPV